jgi:DNA-directed RNA polymerase subunit RPC12/RpoP
MPIRFRCAYCNQLMGISRRKAGTVIRCPNCAGQVIVPKPEAGADEPPELPAPHVTAPQPVLKEKAPLFEGSDFDKIFEDAAPGTGGFEPQPFPNPGPPLAPPLQPKPQQIPQGGFDVEALATPGPGIFLTPGKLTVVCVILVVLLGAAFLVGFLVGHG